MVRSKQLIVKFACGWNEVTTSTEDKKIVRSRSASVVSLYSDKSEKESTLLEINKLAKLKADKVRSYLDEVYRLVRLKQSLEDLESNESDDVDREWELNH